MKKSIPSSDPAGENTELRLHIRELEMYIDALKTSDSKFWNLFLSTPLGMLIFKLTTAGDLILTDMNPAARRIFQITDNSLIGKTIEEAFPPLTDTKIPGNIKKWRVMAICGTGRILSIAMEG